MTSQSKRDPDQGRLYLLASVLFISYLCIGLSLPVVPIFVSKELGLDNMWAGLAVGVAFLSTILTRGHAGSLTDRRGTKFAVGRGSVYYAVGAVMCLIAGLASHTSFIAFSILVVGRLLLGLGESLVAVGIIGWGIGIVGPARSGKVLVFVGAAIYGALAIGGPIGLILLDRFGFSVVMAISAILPCLGLIAVWPLAAIAPHAHDDRPPFWSVIGTIWWHGLIVCLCGIGFAAIGTFFTLYFRDQSWSYSALGLTAFGGGFILMRILFSHLPDRIGGLTVAIGSLAVETVGQLLIWGAGDPILALAGAFLTGLGCSLIYPSMGREVVHLVKPHLRSTALGAFSAFQDIANGLTGPLAGFLADRSGYGSVYLIGGAAAGAGCVIAFSLRRIQAAAVVSQ